MNLERWYRPKRRRGTETAVLFGKYQLERVIGRGRSGTVFLARHLGLDEERAIKRVRRTESGFIQEAALLKRLRHPGIPIIYDLEIDENYYYLIEEYLCGESLYARIERTGSLQTGELIRLGIELCRIMNYLHSFKPNPILYLDLHPGNLLICREQLKLIDFDQAALASLSQERSVCYGTKGFAAPEQYEGGTLDERTDIYAIGALLYYMGTGHAPEGEIKAGQGSCRGDLYILMGRCLRTEKKERCQSVGREVWALLTGGPCDPMARDIILKIRLIKAVVAVLAGFSLAASGLLMQTLFRNPLAGPFVLGISSGASLGVALFLLGAAAGHRRAFVAGQRRYGGRRMDRVGAHPVVDHGCQPPYQGHHGNSDSGNDVRIGRRGARRDSPIHEQRGGSQIVRRLDDGIARRRDDPAADAARAGRGGRYGIDVCRTQTVESAAAGRTLRPHDGAECRPYTHVDLSGHDVAVGYRDRLLRPDRFRGLAVPHLARMLFASADHRVLMPASMLLGAAMLLGCDLCSKQLALPVNTLTALMGIPIVGVGGGA